MSQHVSSGNSRSQVHIVGIVKTARKQELQELLFAQFKFLDLRQAPLHRTATLPPTSRRPRIDIPAIIPLATTIFVRQITPPQTRSAAVYRDHDTDTTRQDAALHRLVLVFRQLLNVGNTHPLSIDNDQAQLTQLVQNSRKMLLRQIQARRDNPLDVRELKHHIDGLLL